MTADVQEKLCKTAQSSEFDAYQLTHQMRRISDALMEGNYRKAATQAGFAVEACRKLLSQVATINEKVRGTGS